MIYAVAAVDQKLGLATEAGIPWKLPVDQAHFRRLTQGSAVLTGFRAYQEYKSPLPDRQNFVIVHPGTELRDGFEPVEDAEAFIKKYQTSREVLWIIGGAKVYERLLSDTQTLYLTRIDHDFSCTKFFPAFEDQFELVESGQPQTENGLTFHFEVWQRKLSA